MVLGTLEVVMYAFLSLSRTFSCDHDDSFYEQHISPSFLEGFVAWEGLMRVFASPMT